MIGKRSFWWKEFPFLRLLIALVPGILAGIYYPAVNTAMGPMLVIDLLLLILFNRLPEWQRKRFEPVRGLLLQLLICCSGCLLMAATLHRQNMHEEDRLQEGSAIGWILELTEPPEEKPASWRAVALIWRIDSTGNCHPTGRSFVYLKKDGRQDIPHYGQRLLICKAPDRLKPPANPGAFDFASYYARQGIHHQVFLRKEEYDLLPRQGGDAFHRSLFEMRGSILSILRKNIPDRQALGIAEALLIGYRGDMDRSITQAYANTGVIHVIAISGLHIGMLYALLMGLTRFINRSGRRYWLQLLMVLPILWLFSLLTGAGPSVMRSACMFTLVGLGKAFSGETGKPLNSLSAAGFLLLCYQPYWILDAGFQLSFTAVAGILLYQKKLQALIPFENPLARQLWEMVTLTLSAQLLTLPLVLYLFQQFPVWFLFTNLLIVPLSSLLLLGEILLCCLAGFPELAAPAGLLIQKGILAMTGYVMQMDNLPYAVIRPVYLSILQTGCFFLAIGSLSAWIFWRQRTWVFPLLLALLLGMADQGIEIRKRSRQDALVIPHLHGQTALILLQGRTAIAYTEKMGGLTSGQKTNREELLQGIFRHFRTLTLQLKNLPEEEIMLLRWKGSGILLVNSRTGQVPSSADSMAANMAILSQNTRIDIGLWAEKTGCKTWIADGSNTLWKIQEWKTVADRLHLQFHSTALSGAFIRHPGGSP